MEDVREFSESIDTDVTNAIPDNSEEATELTEEPKEDITPVTDINEGTDYAAVMEQDVLELASEFPELRNLKDITELDNPLRYAALRDLGLTSREAYLATSKRRSQDTRSHLMSAHGRSAATSVGMMSQHELSAARELFPGLCDSQIQKLYKKVTR